MGQTKIDRAIDVRVSACRSALRFRGPTWALSTRWVSGTISNRSSARPTMSGSISSPTG